MLELYLLTFNCARELVDPETLAPPFFDALPASTSLPDVVAISLQEVSPITYSFLGGSYLTPYFEHVTATVHLAAKLRSHGAEQLEHVATRSLGMTALMIFAKPRVAERIQWMQSAGAGVGFWNMGNKGAVAMRLGVACRRPDEVLQITFIAAHLAPMESNIEARNQDWENIVRNLVFLNKDTSGYSSTEEQPLLASVEEPPADNNGLFTPGNHVFFYGDLNYRTHDTPPEANSHIAFPQPARSDESATHYSQFLRKDQLNREREAKRTLHGFSELPIDFPPTYKYSTSKIKGSGSHKRSSSESEEQWLWAKHRYPSWCDRILFLPSLSSSKLEPQIYTTLPVQATSDHRPVALSLKVDEKPLSTNDEGDVRAKSPFPINPQWKARRDAARRLEVVVGVLSYLALTKKGNAIVVLVTGLAFTVWFMGAYLGR
ncbi:DNase I-like protein [Amniculicola lignicola CBS 123094]|uniref:DNase I-like protein n=1 Tax=Amniculicola lignicola CBS 123094 TaxID=1392246 RepID=A0A6A5W2G4_9PLEO|nr:DNase I-like protein [Amniculicola lignicola CBS 123094]